MSRETISPTEAATKMGVAPNVLRKAIKSGEFPIGWAYRGKHRWVYVIPKKAFERFMDGEIIINSSMISDFIFDKHVKEHAEKQRELLQQAGGVDKC